MEIDFFKAKKNITVLWFSFSALLFIFMFFQTILGRYNHIKQEAWEWFLSAILPSISIIISGFLLQERRKPFVIKKIYSSMGFGISFFYLFLILILLLSYSPSQGKIIEYYKSFDLPLKAVQSIVTGLLALFFINKK